MIGSRSRGGLGVGAFTVAENSGLAFSGVVGGVWNPVNADSSASGIPLRFASAWPIASSKRRRTTAGISPTLLNSRPLNEMDDCWIVTTLPEEPRSRTSGMPFLSASANCAIACW